jgi:malate dehydrogenase
MAKAVIEDSGEEMPVCAWMAGEYGIDDVYLGVVAKIGAGGVQEIARLPLTDDEAAGLAAAAVAVKEKVADLAEIDI